MNTRHGQRRRTIPPRSLRGTDLECRRQAARQHRRFRIQERRARLIFLKYISDKFDQKYQELVEEGEGFEEDRDEYASENIFFVPESARWKTIAAAAHTPEIGKVIDEAMRQIEAENNKLKGILPKNFARQELDKRRLGEVVDLFTNVKMAEKGDSRDILGRTYEYCLAKFAEAEGKNAGEFYTPRAS